MNARLSHNQTQELLNWLQKHRQQLAVYKNEYIAYNAQKLIARSPDLSKVLAVTQVAKRPFVIYFVPPNITSIKISPLSLGTVSKKSPSPNYPAILQYQKQRISTTVIAGSGAELTTVPKQVGKDLGYCLLKGEKTLLAKGGEEVEYVVRTATLNIGDRAFKIPVIWLQQELEAGQVLLGQEIALEQFQAASSGKETAPNPKKIENNAQKAAKTSTRAQVAKKSAIASAKKTQSKTQEKAQQSDRIPTLTQFIKSVASLIWAIVFLIVIIPLLGKVLLTNLDRTKIAQPSLSQDSTVVVKPTPPLSEVNTSVADAIKQAEANAELFASQELDLWESQMAGRVDGFLDWYFGYFNQKKIEFSTPFAWLSSAVFHKFNPNHPSASQAVAEKLTEDFQREFAKRVLLPKNAQMRLEVITTETINLYLSELGNEVAKVQSKYKIPQGNWDRYLDDISTTIHDTEGNISNLSLKVLAGGGGYLLAKPLVLGFAGKVGSKVSGKLAGKAAAKVAAKTGGAVGAELGASLIDPIVGIGILVWDIWDYSHTVDIERPILQENILDYLQDVKRSLLSNPENGVMAAVYQLESGILQSLPAAKSPSSR